MTYKRDWDKNKPEDHLLIAEIPQVFRWLKEDIAQRLKDWIYGFISGETKIGLKKAPLHPVSSDPATESDKGILYVKEVNGIKELFYKDSGGNVKQLTSQGKLNLTDEGVVYLTGDQTINGVKTFVDGLKAPDPSDSNDVATKGYVDNLPHPDEKVKASPSDTTAGYLSDKVDGVTIDVNAEHLYVKDSSISQAKLKTATGSGSHWVGVGGNNVLVTLPGGEYGFYPLIAVDRRSGRFEMEMGRIGWADATYRSRLGFHYYATTSGGKASATFYWKQRYITASGYYHWIYLLLDKENRIKGVWVAPDHPSANIPALPDEIPHPFSLNEGDKVIVVDESVMDEVKELVRANKGRKTPAEILTEEFILDDWEGPKFKPVPIIKIDEWDAYEGKRVAEIKVPQWCRVMFNNDKVCLKEIVVDRLPSGIEFRKMRKNEAQN